MAHSIPKRHPELVSGSHREPSLILLRGQMLKQKLTLFNLLTLGIAQASLALLSLSRKFQHDNTRSQKPTAKSQQLTAKVNLKTNP